MWDYIMNLVCTMAVASSQAGQVLARPLFHGHKLHMCILNYVHRVEETCSRYCHPWKATKGNAVFGFVAFTAISVAISSLYIGAMKPKMWRIAYHCPTQVVWLWHVHAAKLKRRICIINRSLSMWLSIVNQNLTCQEKSASKRGARPQTPST